AQEEAILRATRIAREPQVPVQLGLGPPRREREVLRAALRVEASRDRDRLDQRRLAGSVVADQECHFWIELDSAQMSDRRYRERVLLERLDPMAPQLHRSEIPAPMNDPGATRSSLLLPAHHPPTLLASSCDPNPSAGGRLRLHSGPGPALRRYPLEGPRRHAA